MKRSISNIALQLPLDASFKIKAVAALAISAAADALDYVAAPLFAVPLIGDIPDAIISATLYGITRSKRSALINLVEFLPLIGDLVPTYTISTILWIHEESRRRKKHEIMK